MLSLLNADVVFSQVTFSNNGFLKESTKGYPPANQLREASDASESECPDTVEPGKGGSSIDLKLSTLESYHQLHGQGDSSQHADNGICPERIKQCLQDPQCSCGECTMPFPLLLRCCKSFWALPKQQQDSILWSLQSATGGHSSKWSIEGQPVTVLCNAPQKPTNGQASWLSFFWVM